MTDIPVVSVGQILMHPRLLAASHEKQERALRDWLSTHEPCSLMRDSFHRWGFGALLEDADGA